MRGNFSRVCDNHTTFDFVFVDTTEKETYVIAGFTFVEEFTEHFNTCNGRSKFFSAKTDDFYSVTNFDNTCFDTTSSNSTTTGDREYVFNRHKEWFIDITWRELDPIINSVHKFHNFLFPLWFAIQSTESRTADDRRIFFEFIESKKFTHFHFNEFEHFFIVNHIAFVQEYNKARNVYLTSEKDVLTSLRHRTISCSNYDDSTVHLSSTGNHVFNVIGVSRTVNVSIVACSCLILYV